MGIIALIVFGTIVSMMVASALGTSWLIAAAMVAGIFLLATGKIGGGSGLGGGISDAVHAITGSIQGLFQFLVRFGVGLVVFVGIMMILDRFIGVAPYRVVQGFTVLGVRPWGWPANIGLPLILWTSVAFLAAGISIKTAHGNWRMAAWIFGISSLSITGTLYLPSVRADAAPTSWAEADITWNDRGGAIGIITTGAEVTLIGKPDSADVKQYGHIGTPLRNLWQWATGEFDTTVVTTTTRYFRALVVEVDAYTTPEVCDSINYEFELDTQGDSINLRYLDKDGNFADFKYAGKGDVELPPRRKGPVCATSLTGKPARVKISRVIFIPH